MLRFDSSTPSPNLILHRQCNTARRRKRSVRVADGESAERDRRRNELLLNLIFVPPAEELQAPRLLAMGRARRGTPVVLRLLANVATTPVVIHAHSTIEGR